MLAKTINLLFAILFSAVVFVKIEVVPLLPSPTRRRRKR